MKKNEVRHRIRANLESPIQGTVLCHDRKWGIHITELIPGGTKGTIALNNAI